MMKRFVGLMLVGLILLSVVSAGCLGGNENTETGATYTESQKTASMGGSADTGGAHGDVTDDSGTVTSTQGQSQGGGQSGTETSTQSEKKEEIPDIDPDDVYLTLTQVKLWRTKFKYFFDSLGAYPSMFEEDYINAAKRGAFYRSFAIIELPPFVNNTPLDVVKLDKNKFKVIYPTYETIKLSFTPKEGFDGIFKIDVKNDELRAEVVTIRKIDRNYTVLKRTPAKLYVNVVDEYNIIINVADAIDELVEKTGEYKTVWSKEEYIFDRRQVPWPTNPPKAVIEYQVAPIIKMDNETIMSIYVVRDKHGAPIITIVPENRAEYTQYEIYIVDRENSNELKESVKFNIITYQNRVEYVDKTVGYVRINIDDIKKDKAGLKTYESINYIPSQREIKQFLNNGILPNDPVLLYKLPDDFVIVKIPVNTAIYYVITTRENAIENGYEIVYPNE